MQVMSDASLLVAPAMLIETEESNRLRGHQSRLPPTPCESALNEVFSLSREPPAGWLDQW